MLLISPLEIARVIDLMQEAGLLTEIPHAPADNLDFPVGEDIYMIEQCDCGFTTCLQWNAYSMNQDHERRIYIADESASQFAQPPNLLITLAIRAKAQGFVRFADYILDAVVQSAPLSFILVNTDTSTWTDVCRNYDPLVVALAIGIVSSHGILPGQKEQENPLDIIWRSRIAVSSYDQ